jgi:hypothetical protein
MLLATKFRLSNLNRGFSDLHGSDGNKNYISPDLAVRQRPGLGQAVKSSSIINMAERTQFQLFVVRHMPSRIRASEIP